MTIQKIHIEIRPMSKPRGQLNRYGAMTHSLKGYPQWTDKFIKAVKGAGFSIPPNFHSLVFQFNLQKLRGHPPDLSNLQGAVEDALVKGGLLPDDNWKILQRFYTFGLLADTPSIVIYRVDNKKELLFLIEKFSS